MSCPLKEAARGAPHLPALDTLAFSELDQAIDQACLELHKQGITAGRIVPLAAPPSPSLIATLFAAWRLGASVFLPNLRLPSPQISALLSRLPTSFATPSAFLLTSGTTACPKIAVLSLQSLLANAAATVPLSSGDRWLLSLPLYHVGGLGILLRCILARATVALAPADPAITHLSYVPTHLYRATPIYKKLKCLLLGGAPIAAYPPALPVYLSYGLTEMGSTVCARKHPPSIKGAYYLGSPLPGREIRLAADGEILVRGTTRFSGYWENQTLMSPPDWFPTRDLGAIHPQEGLAIIGRKDWQFISGGENVQPEEIEQHLLQIPEIIEAVVVPRDDAEFGKRPVAFVVATNPKFDLFAMQNYLAPLLPKFKIPIALLRLSEMPRRGLKVDRSSLTKIVNEKIESSGI